MNRARRLQIEETLLRDNFGTTFRIQGAPGHPAHGVIGKLKTNSGRDYAVFLEIDDFPDSPPDAYIVAPILLGANGRKLPNRSYEMHTLGTNEHGHVCICHYAPQRWTARVTLYKVVLKVRIWLEAYEGYLRTGKSIDRFLSHMPNEE